MYTTFKTLIICYGIFLVVTTLFRLFVFVCNDITALSFFVCPSYLIYVTENILNTEEEKRKIVKAFPAAVVLKV